MLGLESSPWGLLSTAEEADSDGLEGRYVYERPAWAGRLTHILLRAVSMVGKWGRLHKILSVKTNPNKTVLVPRIYYFLYSL